MKLPVLPVYYYHDHFIEMLAFVDRVYGSILTEQHRAFIERFRALSKDAQCLLIRMVRVRLPAVPPFSNCRAQHSRVV